MFKFEGKSPMEQFTNLVKIWALLCVVLLASCVGGFQLDKPYTEKKSYDATMMNAYSTYKNCGHKGRYECEVFKGRFKVKADGKYYEREIDGFFYNRFVDEGKKEMPAYITLSKSDMGIKSPGYIVFLMSMGVLGFIVFIAGGMMLMFGSIDAESAQRDWEYRKNRETRTTFGRNW